MSFKVTDRYERDGVREARFYFSTPVTADTAVPETILVNKGPGKTEIRLHHGTDDNPGGGCGSAGCIVAPRYEQLRDRLIELYQADFTAFNGAGNIDTEVAKVYDKRFKESKELWTNTKDNTGTEHLTAPNWNDKIKGTLWIIRPDERPERPEIG